MNDEYLQYVNDRMIRQRADALKKSEPSLHDLYVQSTPVVRAAMDDWYDKLHAEYLGSAQAVRDQSPNPETIKDPIAKMFAKARTGDYY